MWTFSNSNLLHRIRSFFGAPNVKNSSTSKPDSVVHKSPIKPIKKSTKVKGVTKISFSEKVKSTQNKKRRSNVLSDSESNDDSKQPSKSSKTDLSDKEESDHNAENKENVDEIEENSEDKENQIVKKKSDDTKNNPSMKIKSELSKKSKYRKIMIASDSEDEADIVSDVKSPKDGGTCTSGEESEVDVTGSPKKEISDDEDDEMENKENDPTVKKEVPIKKQVDAKKSGEYNPQKDKYNPDEDCIWNIGEDIPYYALARSFQEVEKITTRLKMIDIIANFYRSVLSTCPSQLVDCVYLTLNELAPAYEGTEIGIGEGLLIKVVAQSTGRSVEKVKADINQLGDIGLVAEVSVYLDL